jgi:outer membrane protein assembly factor BamB
MPRRFLLAAALAAIAAPTARAQVPLSQNQLPTRQALARLGLEKHWLSVVPLSQGERVLSLNVAGGQLFVQTSRGHLHAFDAESGRYRWGARLGATTANALPVSVNSDQVFVSALDSIVALDRWTGRLIWRTQVEPTMVASTASLPSTGTAADENLALVGLATGKLVAYNTRDRTKETPPGRSAGTIAWGWQTGAPLSSQPMVTPHVDVFGSQDGKVYGATKGNVHERSALLYRFLAGGPISANLGAVGNRTVVVPCEDNNIYGIDLFTGEPRWTVATGAPFNRLPLVAGDTVYVINSAGRLFAIDGHSGRQLWDRFTRAQQLVAVGPLRLYLVNSNGDLLIVDRATGRVVAEPRDTYERAGLNLRDLPIRYPNTENDRLFFASPSGVVTCLRELGHSQPTPLRDPALAPFGTIPEGGFSTTEDVPVMPPPPDAGAPVPGGEPFDDQGVGGEAAIGFPAGGSAPAGRPQVRPTTGP